MKVIKDLAEIKHDNSGHILYNAADCRSFSHECQLNQCIFVVRNLIIDEISIITFIIMQIYIIQNNTDLLDFT